MMTRFGSAIGSTLFRWRWPRLATAVALAVAVAGCRPAEAGAPLVASIAASTPEEAGRYIISIAGCNDCHTDGYMETNGEIDESLWLLGSAVGWRGPWGTTYPPNLRLSAQSMTEDQWVEMLGTRQGLPPMPWPSVNHMSDADRRAVYRYLRQLGPGGEVRAAPLAPGVEPVGPWLDMEPKGLPITTEVSPGA